MRTTLSYNTRGVGGPSWGTTLRGAAVPPLPVLVSSHPPHLVVGQVPDQLQEVWAGWFQPPRGGSHRLGG